MIESKVVFEGKDVVRVTLRYSVVVNKVEVALKAGSFSLRAQLKDIKFLYLFSIDYQNNI